MGLVIFLDCEVLHTYPVGSLRACQSVPFPTFFQFWSFGKPRYYAKARLVVFLRAMRMSTRANIKRASLFCHKRFRPNLKLYSARWYTGLRNQGNLSWR